jgi:hypothetical protein
MDEEDGVIYSRGALLDAYPIGHPLHTLAHMATHLAEHPAILTIEVVLTREEHTGYADVLVCVEPGAYPMDDVLAPFGQAVALATGVDFEGVLPMDFPSPGAEPGVGHMLAFVEVPD